LAGRLFKSTLAAADCPAAAPAPAARERAARSCSNGIFLAMENINQKNGLKITGIGFGMAEKFNALDHNSKLDIVFHLEENNFRDVTSLQLKVIDFDVAGKK
jgi:hypothetical protein